MREGTVLDNDRDLPTARSEAERQLIGYHFEPGSRHDAQRKVVRSDQHEHRWSKSACGHSSRHSEVNNSAGTGITGKLRRNHGKATEESRESYGRLIP